MSIHRSARAAFAAFVLLPSAVLAATASASLGAAIPYRYEFEGWFWDAQRVESHHALTPALVNATSPPRADATRDAAARADAEVVATAAALFARAPEPMRRDQHWTTTIAVRVGENGEERIDVPVEVRVVAEQDGALTVHATGAASGQASGGGYRTPVDVRVRLAAHVTAATIDQLREAVEEDVHAGPYSRTMRWNWKLTAPTP